MRAVRKDLTWECRAPPGHSPGSPVALVFDFDGVILESADLKTQVFAELFRHKADHLPAILDLHQRLGGVCRYRKFDMIHRDILRWPLDEIERQQLGQRFAALVAASIDACPFVPGALEFLIEWAGRTPMFVASGTPDDELRSIVRRRGLERFFVEVHGSPRQKPEIINDLLQRHGLAASEVVFIGDSQTDYQAAHETGLRFVGRRTVGAKASFPAEVTGLPDLTGLALELAAMFSC
ncbi:HAD family hydrolase [uncultured Gammaproteobacteria bacterium]